MFLGASLLLSILFFSTTLLCQDSQNMVCAEDGSSSSYTEQLITRNSKTLRQITASGCPNHPHPQLGPNAAYFKNKTVLIPATPCINSEGAYNLSRTVGSVGITFNGVSIFTAWTGIPEDPDAIVSEAIGFDGCGGHATATGIYHYHMSPACLLHELDDAEDVSISHSPQIGWIYDGFPVYGPHGTDGNYSYRCSHPNSNEIECLDSCNGHTHDIGTGFLYHYHITGPVGDLLAADQHSQSQPSLDMFPYTIGCLKGVPNRWGAIHAAGNTNACSTEVEGVSDGYIPTVMDGMTDPHTPWPLGNGETCTFHQQCQSGYCNSNGICRKFKQSARGKSNGKQSSESDDDDDSL